MNFHVNREFSFEEGDAVSKVEKCAQLKVLVSVKTEVKGLCLS